MSPTSSQPSTPTVQQSETASSVYISVGAIILVLLVGVEITLFVVIGVRCRNQRKLRNLDNLQKDSELFCHIGVYTSRNVHSITFVQVGHLLM